ncbi:hypothetical protein PR202_ga15654 [Eleusine coracana subsp. coracana]|uniref:Prolyl endopeptidase-like n=1 Tax=Eleusine coracana subsp. coracana TaxID=191504 RepID=A0AAV5CKT2_ELECO|nr:hypothetical protein PR202_ga15654 [Eleusine coracana subsp. coracana]
MRGRLNLLPRLLLRRHVHRRSKPSSPPPPPPPPNPPRPPQKPEPVSIHGETWYDSYAWMGALSDAAAMRHMDVHMEAEEKYTEACLAACGADRLARKLQLEMASRLASDACTPPVRWGPWLYYRRTDEGKQYPVLCRRSAALHNEFVSYSDPSAGFDFTAGKRIEQKLVDYNKEAERFGGYSYEELSEVSPDHRFIAYTMYDKDKDSFTLLVRDLVTGTLLDKPRADRVSNISWAMDGKALMPDAVVDYNLLNGKWQIVQQQNLLYERTKALYGTAFAASMGRSRSPDGADLSNEDFGNYAWNELSEYYACEYYDVPSKDGVLVPLMLVYSRKHKQDGNPGLLHGHGAYGEILDKRWRRVVEVMVRSGTRKVHVPKTNSVYDFVSCDRNHSDAKSGTTQVPFLDVCNTLLHPILPLTAIDYEEFGFPVDHEEFLAIMKYSPYDNIQKDVPYPAVFVTSSFNTRFGVWEAAKWVAKVRELTYYDPERPVVLNLTTDVVEESKYLQTKELALETAFLIKMTPWVVDDTVFIFQ